MRKFVVFVFPNTCTNKVVEVKDYASDNSHIKNFASSVIINNVNMRLFAFGDYLWNIRKINNPIDIQGNLYHIVDMIQWGYYFSQEVSYDGGETFETIDSSKSFFSYGSCYNAMKEEAMKSVSSNIDIEQDFEDNDVYNIDIEFKDSEITYKFGQITRFKMFRKL